MVEKTKANFNDPIKDLEVQWFLLVSLSMFGLIGISILLQSLAINIWLFLTGSFPVLVWLLWRAKRFLPNNRISDSEPLNRKIGTANWITLIRGVLIAYLAGFIFIDWPVGWIAWFPASIYLIAVIMDFIDGAVARLTGSTSILGMNLDMDMDGLGIFIASVVAVNFGQIPWPYLLVGTARYLFLIGIFIRNRFHKPVYDLPQRSIRRALAGVQMGFLAAVLFPVFTPPVTFVAAYIVMVPFLVYFFLDFMAVSGSVPKRKFQIFTDYRLILLRVFLFISGFIVFLQSQFLHWGLIVLFLLSLLMVITGTAARMAALTLIFYGAFHLRIDPSAITGWVMLLAAFSVFWLGSGRYALWQPENFLLYKRIGESNDKARS